MIAQQDKYAAHSPQPPPIMGQGGEKGKKKKEKKTILSKEP